MGTLGAALDAGGLDVPDRRHRVRVVVGLLRTGLGWFLVLGSGGKRQLHAVASGRRAAAFGHRRGKARGTEKLDDPSGDHGLWLFHDRHLHRSVRRHHLGPQLCQRSGARGVHPCHSGGVHGRRPDAVCGTRGWDDRQGRVFPRLARGGADPEQRAAGCFGLRRVHRNHVAAVRGNDVGSQIVGRRAVLQPGVHAL